MDVPAWLVATAMAMSAATAAERRGKAWQINEQINQF